MDLVEEEEHQKAWKLDEAASAPPETHQGKELIGALQPQHLEWFLHFESTQEEMVLELLAPQVQQNYHPCDQQEDFALHNLTNQYIKIINGASL